MLRSDPSSAAPKGRRVEATSQSNKPTLQSISCIVYAEYNGCMKVNTASDRIYRIILLFFLKQDKIYRIILSGCGLCLRRDELSCQKNSVNLCYIVLSLSKESLSNFLLI